MARLLHALDAPEIYLVVHETAKALLGCFLGRLIIVGGGRCVWNDLESIGFHHGTLKSTDIMCINDIVMHFPGRVKHFFSNDCTSTPHWLSARRRILSKTYGAIKYVHTCDKGADYNWPWPGVGTSALGAIYSGLAMGYESIVLCGIPLDDSGHYFDPPWIGSDFMNNIGVMGSERIACWEIAKARIFNNKVTSCSGRTRKLLGSP